MAIKCIKYYKIVFNYTLIKLPHLNLLLVLNQKGTLKTKWNKCMTTE